MSKIFLMFVVMLFSTIASATTPIYYSSPDECEVAYKAGKTETYKPTGKHKLFGDARISKYEKRGLEADSCVYLGALPGYRWVFLPKGTEVYTKKADVYLLAECQNNISKVVVVSKDDDKPAAIVHQRQPQEPNPGTADYTPDVSKIKTIGGARCNFFSDGSLRLKESPKQVIAVGEKVTPSVMQRDLPNGQTCQQWREEFQRKYTYNPTPVVQM